MQIRIGLVTAVLVIVTELLCLALTSQRHGLQDAFTVNLPHRHDPLTHYFLSRYSPGTSSCGTSCVRTSPASASSASSTPFTTSASNAFPSSSNSSTLSESAPWTLDNPCKSPDCSPGRAPSPSSPNATVSTLWCFPRTCSLSAPSVSSPVAFLPPASVLSFAFFGAAFFFANFFLGVTLFLASLCLIAILIGANFLPAVLFDFACFFLVFFLFIMVAIRAVYHRSLPGADSEEKTGAGGARSREKDWKGLRVLRLRCGGFGFGELRDDAELLHEAQSVPVDIAFRHFAVRDAGDGHSGNGERLPGWHNPAEIPFMGTAAGPTGHDRFAFGDDVLDRHTKVGESSAVESRSLLFTLRAAPKIGCRRVVVFVVGCKELVYQRQIALVPNFFNKTTDDSFVIF